MAMAVRPLPVQPRQAPARSRAMRRNAVRRSAARPGTPANQNQLSFELKSTADDLLDVDLFAGGGGASEGIEQALGKPVDIAVNHDPHSIGMHEVNHPRTEHFQSDVFEVEPSEVCRGRAVRSLWASPDCRHWSRASSKPLRSPKIRGLMWVVVKWARLPDWQRPRIIFVENVPEMLTAGPCEDEPLLYPFPDGSGVPQLHASHPVKALRGLYFQQWLGELKALGYTIEWRVMNMSLWGAPTIRTRLFIIARRDGEPIVWPPQTHGAPDSEEVRAGNLKPYRWSAECIDFSLQMRSIFGRTKPLADATMDRLAHGVHRFMIAASLSDGHEPFVVTINHKGDGFRGFGTRQPGKTITAARDAHGLVMACTAQLGHTGKVKGGAADGAQRSQYRDGSRQRKYRDPREPAPALVTKNEQLLLAAQAAPLSDADGKIAIMAQHNGGEIGHSCKEPSSTITRLGTQQQPVVASITRFHGKSVGQLLNDPATTVETVGKHGLQGAHLLVLKGTCKDGRPLDKPGPAVLANGLHYGEVRTSMEPVGALDSGAVPFEDALLSALPQKLWPKVREVRRFLARVNWRKTRGLNKMPPAPADEFLEALTVQCGYEGPATDLPHLLGLCKIDGVWYQIVELEMRMLTARELANIQDFPPDYIIDRTSAGVMLTQAQQVARIGNSVPPSIVKLLVAANLPHSRHRMAA